MISDEIVEVGARAILAAELWPGAWEKATETERGHALYKSRDSLLAVAPMILEEAAKALPSNVDDDGDPWNAGYNQALDGSRAAIRAMKPPLPDHDKGGK